MSGYAYQHEGQWRPVNLDAAPTGTGAFRRVRTALRDGSPESLATLAEFGVYPYVVEGRPDDTATTTWDRDGGTLAGGTVTVVWVERNKTADELDRDDRAAEGAGIDQMVVDRLTQIVGNIEGATAAQTQTAVKDLARLLRRIVRSEGLDR